MSRKFALVIGNGEYQDTRLARLKKPIQDAAQLATVLGDPAIGGFEVKQLINQSEKTIRREISRFFNQRKRDDLLLLYFSGHVCSTNKAGFSSRRTTRNPKH